jgi:TonB family protein
MKFILTALLCAAMCCAAQEIQTTPTTHAAGEDDPSGQTLALGGQHSSNYSITGTVIDRVSHEPVANAKVTILGTDHSTQSSKDGQYTIGSVPEGIYQIKAEAGGYEPEIMNNIPLGQERGNQRVYFTLLKVLKEASANFSAPYSQLMPPPDFVPVDKQPVPIKNPAPVYPVIARRAGIEGTVWVKIWVDETGKVRKAQVIKTDKDILNQSAINAAIQWTFTPAILNGKPVAVWVSVPFKFKLNPAGNGKDDTDKQQPAPVKKPKKPPVK